MATWSDDFNRADAATLGANYGTITGQSQLRIVSNQAAGPAASTEGTQYLLSSVVAFGPDQGARGIVSGMDSGSDYAGVGVRMGGGDGYVFITDGASGAGHTEIGKWLAGVYTILVAVAATFANGDELGLDVTDDAPPVLTALKNGTSVGTFNDVTDPILTGQPGLDTYGVFPRIDNFSAFDVGADTTAPVLSSPTGTATGSATATVGATTDEGNGTLYAVVTTSSTQPSIAQIKAGQDHTGAAAAWAGSQAISSTGAKTFNANGLTSSTVYYAHLVHTDAASNNSNRISSASFTTYQRLMPASDISAGAWVADNGGLLYASINENPASDADFIKTYDAGGQCVVGLQSGSDPAVSTGHTVSYRVKGDGISGLIVHLMQGATVIATWTHDPLPTGWTVYSQTLSGAEADSITDYTALRLRFTET